MPRCVVSITGVERWNSTMVKAVGLRLYKVGKGASSFPPHPPSPPPSSVYTKNPKIGHKETQFRAQSYLCSAMGISSMPCPSDSVMTTLVMNTVVTITILKAIVRSVLGFFGVRMAEPGPDQTPEGAAMMMYYCAPSEPSTTTERFRSRFKPVRFGSAAARRRSAAGQRSCADCRVCLARFEQDSVVNRLDCGHLFHRDCLEKWLDYHHVTCPLCRTYVLPGGDGTAPSWSSWFS